ncbi:MAG TPA: IPT/TIG domain-containing protein [Thermoanaerobaculia bacterium]|nr:IPT/TIG domain-containing protein [Thermoanaerobaculia bacterium]
MKTFRQRKFLFALLAMLVIFAGCKGESPTAPPPSSGGGSTPGGGTPATGTTITVSFSNNSPVVGSPVTVSASVTQNNQAVPNGTAVELTTSLGTFSDTGTATTIRTTTNGVATAILNVATPGTATVTATINNVARTGSVTFRAEQVPPTPTPTNPTITGVTPSFGKPSGGETITINGTNFTQPVRVFFDFGNNTPPVEAFVLPGSTSTQLQVLTPRVDLGAGQTKTATITVITQAGSANEQRATSQPFTFAAEQLTPIIAAVSPASGPINGGTRVTIFGEAFQSPVQVFFGSSEAQVINVQFNQIIVLSPPGRDTSPNGGTTVTGPVNVRVVNIRSNKEASLTAGFRYTPAMQITAISPTFGSAIGGTDVTIDGTGFDDPVSITFSVGGVQVQAQPLRVSGTQILARMGPLPSPCAGATGPITVTNVENGGTANSPPFTYVGVTPVVVSVVDNTPGDPLLPGQTATVTVRDPGIGPLGTANIRFVIGGVTVVPAPSTINVGTGNQAFTVMIPTGLTFPSIACSLGGGTGSQLGPGTFDAVFNNVTTTCTDRLVAAVQISPPGPNPCTAAAPTATVGTPSPACPVGPSVDVSSGTAPITINVANTAAAGGQSLQVTGVINSGNGDFTAIAPSGPQTVTAGSSVNYTVTFDPTLPGQRTGTVRFTTNDPARPTIDVQVCGTGSAPPSANIVGPAPPCPAGASATVGTQASITITVQNNAAPGSGPLTVTGAIFANAAEFPTVAPAGQQTLNPGQQLPFTVTFQPTSVGIKNGTVRFTTNDPARPVIDVPVCGTGT